MSNIDRTKTIHLTKEIPEDVLGFLDLKLKFVKEYKRISVDISAKVTNSFTYVFPSICFPKNNIENVSKGVTSRLRRTFYSDDRFEERGVQ